MSIINRFPTGGADSEELTATKSQVLSPYTAVTHDSDGEPIQGTMVDNGAVNYSLPINGTYTVPQGYHNGQGKVTQSIATMNGSTINPSTSTVTIGTDKKYVNGNFTIPGFSLPNANVIKKGVTVTIYGKSVTGTFEGWVPVAGDWYYNGVYQYGWGLFGSSVWRNENTRIYCHNGNGNSGVVIKSSNYFDLRSYSTLTISGKLTAEYSGSNFFRLFDKSNNNLLAQSNSWQNGTAGNVSFDISQLTTYSGLYIWIAHLYTSDYITRIRVS